MVSEQKGGHPVRLQLELGLSVTRKQGQQQITLLSECCMQMHGWACGYSFTENILASSSPSEKEHPLSVWFHVQWGERFSSLGDAAEAQWESVVRRNNAIGACVCHRTQGFILTTLKSNSWQHQDRCGSYISFLTVLAMSHRISFKNFPAIATIPLHMPSEAYYPTHVLPGMGIASLPSLTCLN